MTCWLFEALPCTPPICRKRGAAPAFQDRRKERRRHSGSTEATKNDSAIECLFHGRFPSVAERAKTEGVGLRVVRHHGGERVGRRRHTGGELVDDAGVLRVRGPARRKRDELLGVVALGVRRL